MFRNLVCAVSACLLLIACEKDKNMTVNRPRGTCLEYMAADNELSILYKAMTRISLQTDTVYQQASPCTFFAPSDSAFVSAGLSLEAIEMMDIDSLRYLLYGHILRGRLGSSTVAGFFKLAAQCLDTGYTPILSRNYYGIFLNGFKSVETEDFGDGIIHKIKSVAFPGERNLWETIRANEQLSMLAASIEITSGLSTPYAASIKDAFDGKDTISPQKINTMLAPTNDAFRALGFNDTSDLQLAGPEALADLLNSQVLTDYQFTADFVGGALIGPGLNGTISFIPNRSGRGYQSTPDGFAFKAGHNIVNPRIIQSNIKATNGVLHIVDQVILP